MTFTVEFNKIHPVTKTWSGHGETTIQAASVQDAVSKIIRQFESIQIVTVRPE